MPGFIGTLGNKTKIIFNKEERKNLFIEYLTGTDYFIERRTINKFLSDKTNLI